LSFRKPRPERKEEKLSQAAMKVAAAAGGDVDKLREEGFVF
jgi:hypothetical protein